MDLLQALTTGMSLTKRLLLALLFVLRKRLENRRLPIMHTRDWKTNLKGQDLFSKIITIIVIKQKN